MKNKIKRHESTKEIQQAIKGVLDEWNLIGELQLEKYEILYYSFSISNSTLVIKKS
ncbi:hypothetical protein [Bacillus hominis]|uniref:hypothetical protein n=1 Tax=Bacillus hominis TaxID=2817478 RepID=UPI001BB37CAD|nr:hypothetical protein [Bacillus hominis]